MFTTDSSKRDTVLWVYIFAKLTRLSGEQPWSSWRSTYLTSLKCTSSLRYELNISWLIDWFVYSNISNNYLPQNNICFSFSWNNQDDMSSCSTTSKGVSYEHIKVTVKLIRRYWHRFLLYMFNCLLDWSSTISDRCRDFLVVTPYIGIVWHPKYVTYATPAWGAGWRC